MSKLKFQGNASGTGVFTVITPATSTDRTLTLPDSAGTILDSTSTLDATKLSGNLPAISGASLTGLPSGGITEADEWRLTADVTSDSFLTTNLERNDTTYFAHLGTGMSHSSGVFTFPSTGFWKVNFFGDYDIPSADYVNLDIYVSVDGGSSWDITNRATAGNSTGQISISASTFLDVTSTGNVKVKFAVSSVSLAALRGDTGKNATYFQFIRLGDT
jgi:hypothetical protein